MSFRWNKKPEPALAEFWDVSANNGAGASFMKVVDRSDAEIIRNPKGQNIRDVCEAMCRIMSELIEIEEKRSKNETSNG